MPQEVSLIQQVEQINQRRYERLSACARKRINPYRFWNDPNRAHRCPKAKPAFQPSDRVVLQSRTIHRQRSLTIIKEQVPPLKENLAAQETIKAHPLAGRNIVNIRQKIVTQTIKSDPGKTEQQTVKIELSFRQTLVERLSQNPITPVDEHARLDMIQLAHEWGIHVYRAQMITDQVINNHRPKHRRRAKQLSYSPVEKTNKGKQQLPAISSDPNNLLIVLITLFAIIDLAIICYML